MTLLLRLRRQLRHEHRVPRYAACSRMGLGIVRTLAVYLVSLDAMLTLSLPTGNCEPRRRAIRLQTKNGGLNHNRWFYTCSLAKHKGCNFFLWEDQARPRSQAALIGGSRDESLSPTKRGSMKSTTGIYGDDNEQETRLMDLTEDHPPGRRLFVT